MKLWLTWVFAWMDHMFGANPRKCNQIYTVFLQQVGYQRNDLQKMLGDNFELASRQIDEYNVSGLFPFIHFMALYCKGVITKNEMIATLYILCESSDQPPDLVYQVFKQIDAEVTQSNIKAAMDPDENVRVDNFNKHGILPCLIVDYKKAVDSNKNFYINVYNSLQEFNRLNTSPAEGS